MSTRDLSPVEQVIKERSIREVLHFTTSPGLVGILASGKVMCRDRLPTEKHIEYVYTPNCPNRLKDAEWTGYVNLSISRVNQRMLNVSSNRWHADDDFWWIVLAFDVSILTESGVFFTTTNNTYQRCVRRSEGADGLRALFAPSVEFGHHGSRQHRYDGMPDQFTTDEQAEVLYPDAIPIDKVRALYVREAEHADSAMGLIDMWPSTPRIPVVHKPEVFQ
jgi:ssDNA thymidine ADP-ribosyltransferase, DarT